MSTVGTDDRQRVIDHRTWHRGLRTTPARSALLEPREGVGGVRREPLDAAGPYDLLRGNPRRH